jgi:hypothetical protein
MKRPIVISPVLNGFVVQVGCQQVVFNDRQALLTELKNFMEAPDDTEKRFIHHALNRTLGTLPPPQQDNVVNGTAADPTPCAPYPTEARPVNGRF